MLRWMLEGMWASALRWMLGGGGVWDD